MNYLQDLSLNKVNAIDNRLPDRATLEVCGNYGDAKSASRALGLVPNVVRRTVGAVTDRRGVRSLIDATLRSNIGRSNFIHSGNY